MNDLILPTVNWRVGFIGSWMPCLKASKEWMRGIRLRPSNEPVPDGQGGVGMAQGEPTYLAGLPQ